jgi:hypothetical protein
MVGLVEDNKLALPLTQEELADATGLTAVHINRAIQRLRKKTLIEIGGRLLAVPDIRVLQHAGCSTRTIFASNAEPDDSTSSPQRAASQG